MLVSIFRALTDKPVFNLSHRNVNTYFYDTGYKSPRHAQMYEYSRLSDSIDFSTFYHSDMWQHNILDETSRTLIEQYQRVPLAAPHLTMGLEFDCGSRQPALFAKLHPYNAELNREIFQSLADIVSAPNATPPALPGITIEDVGVFPERATGLFRILVRADKSRLRQFADRNECVNTDIITESSDTVNESMGVSFDWDGITMSNFMFHSATIHRDNSWVKSVSEHAHRNIAQLFSDRQYRITQFVKVSLTTNTHPDYMKAYFTVRWS